MSNKKLYVGNISFSCVDDELYNLFSKYGIVFSVKIVKDQFTGKSKGFGFVEMEEAGAMKALQNLNGYSLSGRYINVNEAKPPTERDNSSRNFNPNYNDNRSSIRSYNR